MCYVRQDESKEKILGSSANTTYVRWVQTKKEEISDWFLSEATKNINTGNGPKQTSEPLLAITVN